MSNESKAIINVKTGQKLTDNDIKSKKPENVKALLVKSGQWIYEGDKIEVDVAQGAKIVENEIARLTAEREAFEAEKAAFAAEREAFEAEKLLKSTESAVATTEAAATEEKVEEAKAADKKNGKK